MADTSTGLPVQSLSGQFINAKIFDTGGSNVAAVSAAGRLSVDASGVAVPITDNSGSITVDGSVNIVTSVVPGTAATHLGKAEDAAHTTGDTGVFVLAVRNDGGTALAGTDGDYIPFTTDATGALRVTGGSSGTQYTEDAASAGGESMTLAGAIRQDTPASSTSADGDYANLKVDSIGRLWVNNSGVTQPENLTQIGGNTVVTGGVNGTLAVGGVLAHDAAAASALPVGIGAFASAAAPTDVSADGDAVKIWALRNGSQVINLASGGTLVTLGQKAMASSLPVVIASDQSAVAENITQIGGSTQSASNPLFVRLTDGTTAYSAASSAPTAPKFSTLTSSALGGGASVDLDATLITNGTTGQLMGVDFASTVPCKIEIKTVNSGGTATTRVVLFSKPYDSVMWRAPYKTFITQAGAASNARFRVTATNKDATVAADVYATVEWDEV